MAWWAIFVQRITAKWQSFDSDRWCCRIAANWCTPLQALQSGLAARYNINSTAKQLHKRYSLAVNPLQSTARFVRGDFICLKYTKSILQITQMAEVCTCCILMLSLRIRPLHIGHLWSSPPRETSVIWALKFHTDDVVLTKIRSNESDWSIYLTPRINSKAKRKARRRKAKSCLEIFFKSVSMMFVASFKLSPLEKSSFGLYTFICLCQFADGLVNRWYSRVLLKVGMPECCNAAMPEIESRNTKTRKHQNKAPDR